MSVTGDMGARIQELEAVNAELLTRLEASTKIMAAWRGDFYECAKLPDGEVGDEEDARMLAEMDADIDANQDAIARARGRS